MPPLGRLVQADPRSPETKDGFFERLGLGKRVLSMPLREPARSGGTQGGMLNAHRTRTI
jgi:hypothetical protein